MVWGDSKRDLIVAENAAAKREIELLREQILDLKEERSMLIQQLKATQEALVAKESPEAYRDMMDSRMSDSKILTPEEKEEQRLKKQKTAIYEAYINELESPLFKDADDIKQVLTRVTNLPISEAESLHGNAES